MYNFDNRPSAHPNNFGKFSLPSFRPEKTINSKIKRNVYLILLLVPVTAAFNYFLVTPRGYFRMPLNIPTEIAGTFGEVRKDHFHLGIDIRTGGRENIPVYAMADGYVYRASIQRHGYGKAIYLAYNNGLMSMYAHLNSFSREVHEAVTKQQLLSEQWEQEMFFPPRMFPIQKGALVGYSGNTGSSEGPHLHLEIRNSKTKTILNPVHAGINMDDNEPPSIRSVWLYSGSRSIYEKNGTGTSFSINEAFESSEPVDVTDSIVGIGIEAADKNELSKFKLGIYSAQLLLDNKLHFEFKVDSIPMAKERYVNATIDYGQWFRNNRIIQYLFRLPGNNLPSYQQFKSNGMVRLANSHIHRITIIVKDAHGNSEKASFRIRYKPLRSNPKETTELLLPGMPHKVSKGSATAYFSPLAFYDAVPFRMIEVESNTEGSVSKTIRVHDPSVPVHTRYRFQLKTKLEKNDPARKYVLMELKSGKEKIYVRGEWKGDYKDGTFDRFGSIRLVVDKDPPFISTRETKRLLYQGDILRLTCKDNTGEIENFTARIDGKWTPFEQKKNSFHYMISPDLKKGKHCLEIKVSDLAGNTTSKKIDFIIR